MDYKYYEDVNLSADTAWLSSTPEYSIGEVAKWLGVTQRTLRFYEEEGIIHPGRTPGGARRFSEQDIGRARVVLRLASLGIPLAEIRQLAEARRNSRTGDEASQRVYGLMEDLEADVFEKLQECRELLRSLGRLKSEVTSCFGCPSPPTPDGCRECPVLGQLNRSDLFSLVWEGKPSHRE